MFSKSVRTTRGEGTHNLPGTPRGDVWRFGEFTLDVVERRLLRGMTPQALSPKAFELLVVLVRARGRLVTKPDLLARVWPDVFVEEGILTVHVSALRKVLDASAGSDGRIETVRGAGYRFAGSVSRVRPKAEESDDMRNRLI